MVKKISNDIEKLKSDIKVFFIEPLLEELIIFKSINYIPKFIDLELKKTLINCQIEFKDLLKKLTDEQLLQFYEENIEKIIIRLVNENKIYDIQKFINLYTNLIKIMKLLKKHLRNKYIFNENNAFHIIKEIKVEDERYQFIIFKEEKTIDIISLNNSEEINKKIECLEIEDSKELIEKFLIDFKMPDNDYIIQNDNDNNYYDNYYNNEELKSECNALFNCIISVNYELSHFEDKNMKKKNSNEKRFMIKGIIKVRNLNNNYTKIKRIQKMKDKQFIIFFEKYIYKLNLENKQFFKIIDIERFLEDKKNKFHCYISGYSYLFSDFKIVKIFSSEKPIKQIKINKKRLYLIIDEKIQINNINSK